MPVTLTVARDADAAGRIVAGRVLDRYAESRGEFLLACPAGRTPTTTYAALRSMAGERDIDLDRLVVVMVDEFVVERAGGFEWCDPTAHFSCYRYTKEHLDGLEIRCPDPRDPAAYDTWLAGHGGVDVFLLASGASDGHVAFNPPGTALDSPTRVVALAESTRRDNLSTFPDFESIDEVPAYGVSVGLGAVVGASEVIALLLGSDKASARARLLARDGFDPSWPASVIHACARASLVVDEATG